MEKTDAIFIGFGIAIKTNIIYQRSEIIKTIQIVKIMAEEKKVILTTEDLQKKIVEKMPKFLDDIFSSDYDNPLKKVIEEEIQEQDGIIRTTVKEIIGEVFKNEEIKKVISDKVIEKIIVRGLRD